MHKFNKIIKNIIAVIILIVSISCEEDSTFGGNNPESGFVFIDGETRFISTQENNSLSSVEFPISLDVATNTKGVKVNYTINPILGELPDSLKANSNRSVTIPAGETNATLSVNLADVDTFFAFEVVLTSTDNPEIQIGLSDNSRRISEVVSTDFINVFNIDENPTNGTVITNLRDVLPEADSFEIFKESVIDELGNDESEINGAFALNSETGELTVANQSFFDWELNPRLLAALTVKRNDKDFLYLVRVNLNDVSTTWTGPNKMVFFSPPPSAPVIDRITGQVSLTWDYNQNLPFNLNVNDSANSALSPVGTNWAVGSISDGIENLNFDAFLNTISTIPDPTNSPYVIQLVKEDIFIDVKFSFKPAGISIERSTPNL